MYSDIAGNWADWDEFRVPVKQDSFCQLGHLVVSTKTQSTVFQTIEVIIQVDAFGK